MSEQGRGLASYNTFVLSIDKLVKAPAPAAWRLPSTPTNTTLTLLIAVSQLPVVRSEHVRAFLRSSLSQVTVDRSEQVSTSLSSQELQLVQDFRKLPKYIMGASCGIVIHKDVGEGRNY